jgi:hypothetical protein
MPPSGGIVESRHDQRWEEMAFLLNSMTVVAMERSLRQKQFPPPLGTGLALLLILITKKTKCYLIFGRCVLLRIDYLWVT